MNMKDNYFNFQRIESNILFQNLKGKKIEKSKNRRVKIIKKKKIMYPGLSISYLLKQQEII